MLMLACVQRVYNFGKKGWVISNVHRGGNAYGNSRTWVKLTKTEVVSDNLRAEFQCDGRCGGAQEKSNSRVGRSPETHGKMGHDGLTPPLQVEAKRERVFLLGGWLWRLLVGLMNYFGGLPTCASVFEWLAARLAGVAPRGQTF